MSATTHSQPDDPQRADPTPVADTVGSLCGPQSGMITGSSYVMDGGWAAH